MNVYKILTELLWLPSLIIIELSAYNKIKQNIVKLFLIEQHFFEGVLKLKYKFEYEQSWEEDCNRSSLSFSEKSFVNVKSDFKFQHCFRDCCL